MLLRKLTLIAGDCLFQSFECVISFGTGIKASARRTVQPPVLKFSGEWKSNERRLRQRDLK